jgi:peptidoglycan/LPS O-acetylase OafA/YrhL
MLAASAVYVFHMGLPAGAPAVLAAFVGSGFMGVTLFFTLSGFVLALNYFEPLRHATPGTLWSYGVARFARIAPLYYLVLLYAIVNELRHGRPVDMWPMHVLAIQAWDPSLADAWALNGVAWSVSVEIFLYASLPLLVVALAPLRSERAITLTVAGVAAALIALTAWFVLTGRAALPGDDPGSAHRWLYRTPLTRIGDFVLGILAARLYLLTRDRSGAVRVGTVVSIVAATAIVVRMAWPGATWTAGSFDVDYAIPSALLIFGLAMAPSSVLARFLALPVIVLLGESSYALYLIHRKAMYALFGGPWRGDLTLANSAVELVQFAVIVAIAIGLHLAVERPARRYVRGIGERFAARLSPSALQNGPR